MNRGLSNNNLLTKIFSLNKYFKKNLKGVNYNNQSL